MGDRVQSPGQEDPLDKATALHSSTLAWKIPRREEPGGLQPIGSQRVGHDWATSLSLCFAFYSATKLCPNLCDPMDCRPPGSSVPWSLQPRTLEWVAIPFSRGVFIIGGLNPELLRLLHCRRFFTAEPLGKPNIWPQISLIKTYLIVMCKLALARLSKSVYNMEKNSKIYCVKKARY